MTAVLAVVDRPDQASTPEALLSAGHRFLSGVRGLPGVVSVFPFSAGLERWFDTPVSDFLADGASVQAWVTIGADRHHPVAATVGLVEAYLRARLIECGFDRIEVRVQVAVLR